MLETRLRTTADFNSSVGDVRYIMVSGSNRAIRTTAPGAVTTPLVDSDISALKADYRYALGANDIAASGFSYYWNVGSNSTVAGHAIGHLCVAEDTAGSNHNLYGVEGKIQGRGGQASQYYVGALGQSIYIGTSRNVASLNIGVMGDVRNYTDENQTLAYTGLGISACFWAPAITNGIAAGNFSFLGNNILQNNDDIVMKKSSAQGYIYSYDTANAAYIVLYHNGGDAHVQASSGGIHLNPQSGSHVVISDGDIIWATDNSYDIGYDSTTYRPRNGYFGGYIEVGAAVPDSPSNGAIGYDSSTQKAWKVGAAGVAQFLDGTIFTQTANKTVANTVTETSLIGVGVGTVTLPADFFTVGKTVRFYTKGHMMETEAAPTLNIKAKLGSSSLVSTGVVTLVAGVSNSCWESYVEFTCRTAGTSGTVQAQGRFDYTNTANLTTRLGMVSRAAMTIDTTTAQVLDLTATWGAANTSNTISATNAEALVCN